LCQIASIQLIARNLLLNKENNLLDPNFTNDQIFSKLAHFSKLRDLVDLKREIQLMETQSETEISSTPKEDDTRTCLTEPDQTEKVEYWLQEKQTCSLNTR